MNDKRKFILKIFDKDLNVKMNHDDWCNFGLKVFIQFEITPKYKNSYEIDILKFSY